MASLDDKEGDAGSVTGAGIEQGAEDFLLRRAQLNFGNSTRQIGGR
jgi:hypothetical protein